MAIPVACGAPPSWPPPVSNHPLPGGRNPLPFVPPLPVGRECDGRGGQGVRSWARTLFCSRTREHQPLDAPAFLSAAGAPLLVDYDLDADKGEELRRALPGRPWTLWRYRELLPLADFAGRVDLGEGGTPLIRLRRLAPPGVEVLVKDESLNPTGSFKARGLSLAVNRARELGAPGVQLASAGNAALALAAYAAAAGLPARLAMPEDTPRSIFERCREHGAEVLSSPGTLVDAAKLLRDDYWNLSTLREPYRVEGKKTMGFELAEQLDWVLPDWIVYPLGGGTGIVGMMKAFDELRRLGLVGEKKPRFVVVQAAGCAPIVRAFEQGQETAAPWENPRTRVWGLRVPKAIGDFLVLRAVRDTQGTAIAVAEERLPEIAARVARFEGLRIGPEGAAAFAALEDLAARGAFREGEKVVVFQTGDPGNYV
ncbi:MAG TPA: threonine synthase [Thermoanaerobaculia bacterium]|nr:threonine synthase [Thermoanaerobaculia bacterium]